MLKILAIAAVLLASPAFAADTITVQIVSDVPGASGTLTRSMTLTQGEMATFIVALEAATATATPSAAADAWLSTIKAEVIRIATGYQTTQALATVTPINPQ